MKKSIAIILSIIFILAFTLPTAAFSTIAVKSVKLDKSNITLNVGQTYKLKVTLTPKNTTQKLLTYITDNKKIATVDKSGIITGVSAGTTTITVYTPNKKMFAKCKVTISKLAPITYTHFTDIVWMNIDVTTPVMKELAKKTGVTPIMSKASADDGQQLTIMAASGDLPDVITVNLSKRQAIVDKMIAGGELLSVSDLMNKYAPDMYNNTGVAPDGLKFHRAPDGKNYYLLNSVWNDNDLKNPDYLFPGANAPNFKIRADVYDAIGNPPMNSPDAFFNALMQIKAKYPKLTPLYMGPVYDGMNLYSAFDFSTNSFLLSEFGLIKYDVGSGKTVTSVVRNPKTVKVIEYYNKLYTNGLLAPESFVDDDPTAQASRDKGTAAVQGYYASDVVHNFCTVNGKTINYVNLPYFTGAKWVTSGAGWLATMITKNAKQPDRIIKYLDFLSSKEGIDIAEMGVEGVTWQKDSNGNPTWIPVAEKEYLADPGKYNTAQGINIFCMFFPNYEGSQLQNQLKTTEDFKANDMYKPFCSASVFYGTMNPNGDSSEGIILNKLVTLSKTEVVKAIMAKNKAECDQIYNDFVKQSDAMGLSKVEAYWTKQYKAAQ